MAITLTKRTLSGSTHGIGLSITSTQGVAPVIVHSLSTSATSTVDEIYIYAQNNYSQAVDLVLEWGTSGTALHIRTPIPPQGGPTLVVPGLVLTGSACSVTAFIGGLGGSASPASALVSVYGYINRIVQT